MPDLWEVVPVSEYVRETVHDHILQKGARFREKGARLRVPSSAVKAWLMAYHECVAIAGELPGKDRRTELEKLTWDAVKKAHEFIETCPITHASRRIEPDEAD